MNDGEIRELAREILARDEFAYWREEPGLVYDWLVWLSDQLRALGSWIVDQVPSWLLDLLSWLDRPGEVASLEPLESILGALSFLVVAAAVVVALRAWSRQRGHRREPAVAGLARVAEDLRVRADTLARQGRFLEAAHAVQLAALQLLLEGRWLELDRFEPNRTLRERLAKSALPELERSEFLALLGQLEARWFGDRGEGRGLFDRWCGLHEKLAALGGPR